MSKKNKVITVKEKHITGAVIHHEGYVIDIYMNINNVISLEIKTPSHEVYSMLINPEQWSSKDIALYPMGENAKRIIIEK